MTFETFQETVWEQGRKLYRPMPWRDDTRPYYVLVSELMLQQTQVARVVPKFLEFVAAFPDEQALAKAQLGDVLRKWQGLGYNRRAKYLHKAAKKLVNDFGGVWPEDRESLMSLPGVGPNTAGAILAYAFDQPVVFIETNIRTVYFHHFFEDVDSVSDAELTVLVEQTLDHEHPREWYWALMDYGAWLKSQGVRNVRQSKHHTPQSKFEGSVRQVRGAILRTLANGPRSLSELKREVGADERFPLALSQLQNESLVIVHNQKYELPD